jgi:alkaline phosphatase
MKWNCLYIVLLCFAMSTSAQQRKYTVANAHSHNDYEQPVPFFAAFKAGFGSIEADIFLGDGKLYVAHDAADIRPERTLSVLYLDPLSNAISTDSSRQLILLIDVKTAAKPTLDTLLSLLSNYGTLTACRNIKIVISGNRPPIAAWTSYPAWLFFDGRFNEQYGPDVLPRVALLSGNYRLYDETGIAAAIKKAHELNKPTRFWATPDNANAWRQLMQLNVDYINTDRIAELAEFLRNAGN